MQGKERRVRYMRKLPILILAVMIMLTSAACFGKDGVDDGRLSVVTTNFALFDFARAVCGDLCNVEMLISPGAESHDFEASLADIAKIADSDLFIYVGGESEDWVGDIFDALDSMGESVNSMCVLDSVETYAEEIIEGMTHVHDESCDTGHEHEHEHEEAEADEHVWTSIPNASAIMKDISIRAAELDPTIAAELDTNRAAYAALLDGIDAEIMAVTEASADRTLIVADRFPFRYFAERYGLTYYAAFPGCTSDTEPSLETVNFLIEKVRDTGSPVFIIEFSDGTTAKAVQAETGCDILTLHSAHNVTREDFENGVTYADIMRQNLDALKDAFN